MFRADLSCSVKILKKRTTVTATSHGGSLFTRPEGFEPTAIGIGIRYSIRAELRAVHLVLSYYTIYKRICKGITQKYFIFFVCDGLVLLKNSKKTFQVKRLF